MIPASRVKFISPQVLIGAFVLMILTSACRMATELFLTPTGTLLPAGTGTASVTPAGTVNLPLIPITGENVVLMQCQFCVGRETHAVLIFPDLAYFDVNRSSPVTCLTADVVNGRRILICRGPESTSFNLNICSDSSNCLQFPVALQPCALLQGGPATPFIPGFLTPLNTHDSDEDDDPAQPGSTASPNLNDAPAEPPRPTNEPKPTKEPRPTKMPKPTKSRP